MADYEEYIQSEEYLEALKIRNKAFSDVERFIRRVKKLADRSPNAITFEDLHLETKKVLDILDQKENVCHNLIADKCEDYTNNEVYNENLDTYDNAVLDWLDILGAEADRVHGSPTPVKNEQIPDLVTEMLIQMKTQNEQVKAQGERMEAQRKLIESSIKANLEQNALIKTSVDASVDKSKGPRPPIPSTPTFCPGNDLNDCKRWKEFK